MSNLDRNTAEKIDAEIRHVRSGLIVWLVGSVVLIAAVAIGAIVRAMNP